MFRSQNQANKTKYKKSKNILKYKEPWLKTQNQTKKTNLETSRA